MNTRSNSVTVLHRTLALFSLLLVLFTAVPAGQAGAVSLDITSAASGTWEATAWPNTQRSGTISVPSGSTTVTGTGTAFLTELSVGNILRTTTNLQIGTVASITSDTELALVNPAGTTRTDIPYHVQGVGPADNVTIANGHNVTIAANPVNQTGTVTVDSGGTLTTSNPGTVFNTLTVNGTVTATDDVAFGELLVNSGGIVDAAGNGTYTAASLTINSGGTVNLSREFAVDSAALIAGTINFGSTSSSSRSMQFLGAVTLAGTASWNEPTTGNGANNTYEFFGDFTNNAASFVTSDASIHTFAGTGKTIAGATASSIARVTVAGTYTNTGTLSVGTTLTGTGTLTNGATGTFNLSGNASITTLANAGTMNKTGAGPISTAVGNFTNTGTLHLNSTGTIAGITNNAGGTVNLENSGTITAFDNATATSVLNISDLTPPTITTLTVGTPGNTVNYSGNGAQTVKSQTYANLVFSGSGDKSIAMANGSTLTTGNLSIAPTGDARASITGPNLSVNSLSLGGFGRINGTWGSSSSAAGFQDDTFFAPTTGYLNVATDTRQSQTITFTSTAPSDAEVGGPTYTPAATASSSLPVTFTVDASAASVCSISAGEVSFLANGTCVINANQAGDTSYQAAPQIQQSFDVKTSQTITFTSTAPSDAEVGGPTYTPAATATSGLPVTFTIDASAASICSISAGEVSFTAAGTCIVNADQAGDGSYHPAPQVQQSFSVGAGTPEARVFIAAQEMTGSPFALSTGASIRRSFAGINNGPVKIEGNVNLTAAERVIYKVNGVNTSFSEVMGLPASQVDNTYWLPWYNNVDLDTQLRFANVSGSSASVHVYIGGVEMTGSPFTLLAGESTRQRFTGVNDGPVQIVSDQPIVAAERVIYRVNNVNTSFSEMMALPASQVDSTYWLPWYNNVDLDTQLRIGNVSNATATVHVFIAGTEVTPVSGITLLAGESTRLKYAGVNDGPVQIVSDQDIVAAERVIYKVNGVNTSFSEVMGLPASQVDATYWLPWYNNVDLDTQLRFANIGVSTATVHVYIGGVEMPGSPFTLLAGESTRQRFTGVNDGPVQIVSDEPIVAAERVIYRVNNVNTSFSEVMGLPDSQLDTTYWLPWYNNVDLDTQLRFGMP